MITFVISMVATLLIKDKKQATKKTVDIKDIIDLSVCKDSKFIIWVVAGNLSMMGYYIPAFYLPCKYIIIIIINNNNNNNK